MEIVKIISEAGFAHGQCGVDQGKIHGAALFVQAAPVEGHDVLDPESVLLPAETVQGQKKVHKAVLRLHADADEPVLPFHLLLNDDPVNIEDHLRAAKRQRRFLRLRKRETEQFFNVIRNRSRYVIEAGLQKSVDPLLPPVVFLSVLEDQVFLMQDVALFRGELQKQSDLADQCIGSRAPGAVDDLVHGGTVDSAEYSHLRYAGIFLRNEGAELFREKIHVFLSLDRGAGQKARPSCLSVIGAQMVVFQIQHSGQAAFCVAALPR